MPFVSQAQRKACWAQYNQDIKKGRTPKWDCRQWEKETKKEYKTINGKKRMVHTGKRGGKYVILDGKKRYV